MSGLGGERIPIAVLADEFLGRYRRGERPSVASYTERFPDLAEDIQKLFPILVEMETARAAAACDGSSQSVAQGDSPHLPVRQLDDYRIIREIGRGGMGIVYEAEQISLGRRVALKTLPQQMLASETQRRRFEREARSAAQLHHTNIVPVFGFGHAEGYHYYTMQLISGLGLDQVIDELRRLNRETDLDILTAGALRVIRREDVSAANVAHSLVTGQFEKTQVADGDDDSGLTAPFNSRTPVVSRDGIEPALGPASSSSTFAVSPSAVLSGTGALSDSGRRRQQHTYWLSVAKIGHQVALALQYAHGHGILHRDIKPSNLLLDLQGTVWVTDFGLAKVNEQQELTGTDDILGTMRYIPPETFEGKSDARGDIYSLGLTLYELLALRPAFSEKDRHQLIRQVTTAEPERLDKLNPRIPRDLVTIVHKAIERDAGHRYATAEEMADDLHRFLEDLPIRARRISPVERFGRWARQNRLLATATVAVASLLLAIASSSTIAAGYFRGLTRELEKARNDAVSQADENATLADALQDRVEEKLKAEERLRGEQQELALRLALGYMQRGLLLCEQGDVAKGLLWLTQSLKSLPAGNDKLERVIRLNLAAWQDHFGGLEAIMHHADEVQTATFSPDGKTILTASDDHTARLWAVPTGEPIGRPMEHQDSVYTAVFSPDGQSVATTSLDGTARLWNASTGDPLGQPLRHEAPVVAIAFSPDGKTILTGSTDHTARLWRFPTGEPATAPLRHDSAVLVVRFHPMGNVVATAGWDMTVRLWDVTSGAPLGSPLPHASPVMALVFSPDGTRLLSGASDGTAQFWDVGRGERIGSPMRHARSIYVVGFSPDGKRAFTASDDHTARIWNVETGEAIGRAMSHQVLSRAASFSPDGNLLVTGSDDQTVRIWDATTGLPVGAALQHQGAVRSVQFSPSGEYILTSGHDATVRLWKTPRGLPVAASLPAEGKIDKAAFNGDASRLVTKSAETVVQVWDIETGAAVGQPIKQLNAVSALAISSDGSRLLVACYDNTVRILDAGTGQPTDEPLVHQESVRHLAISNDKRHVLAVCKDRTGWIWDLDARRIEFGPLKLNGTVHSAAYHPDGSRFVIGSGSRHQSTQLYDAETARVVASLPHLGMVQSVVFSRRGDTFVTGSFDRFARLWDSATGRTIGEPFPHSGPVKSVAINSEGSTILVGGFDPMARLWDVATTAPIGPPIVHGGTVHGVAFRPDSQSFVTVASDNTLRKGQIPAPLTGDVDRLVLWSQVLTSMELTPGGSVTFLDAPTWNERHRQLHDVREKPLP